MSSSRLRTGERLGDLLGSSGGLSAFLGESVSIGSGNGLVDRLPFFGLFAGDLAGDLAGEAVRFAGDATRLAGDCAALAGEVAGSFTGEATLDLSSICVTADGSDEAVDSGIELAEDSLVLDWVSTSGIAWAATAALVILTGDFKGLSVFGSVSTSGAT